MRSILVAVTAVAFLCSCGAPNIPDAGTGGGRAGGAGGSSGGGTGGSAGSAGGGSGGSTGGGSGGGSGGGAVIDAGYTALVDLCAGYIDGICSYYARCGFAETTQGCLQITTERFNPFFYSTCLLDEKASLDAGHLVYDGRNAAACLYALRTTAPCVQGGTNNLPECQTILIGQITPGNACSQDFECTTGNYCDSSLAMCPGQCRPKKAAGADAGSDEECQPGFYAYQGRCRMYALTGLSCAPLASGAPLQQCRPGEAGCSPASMTCVAPRAAGYPCTGDGDCAFPLRCSANGTGTCVLGSGLGQVCGYGLLGGPSQPCKLDLGCSDGLARDGGACRPLSVLGGECLATFECAGSAVCRGTSFIVLPDAGVQVDAGSCGPPLDAGALCNVAASECDLFSTYCQPDAGLPDAGRCAPRRATNSGCGSDGECTPLDACVGGTCRRAICVP